MNNTERLYHLVKPLSKLGEKLSENKSYLIGNPYKDKPYYWLIKIFSPITEKELQILRKASYIPNIYATFLTDCCNGLDLFLGTLPLFDYRKNMKRISSKAIQQLFDIITSNIHEQPRNSKNEYFFFGYYNCDGSLVYINTTDNSVCLCKKDDAAPLHTWNTFESFLEIEIKRICSLLNEHGEEKEPNRSTLPIG